MRMLTRGRYQARIAATPGEIAAAQALRNQCFRGVGGHDRDAYDARCDHVLVEERASGVLVACFRLLPLARGKDISQSYSAQYYELSALESFDGPVVELGRFCIAGSARDPDILRVAWGAMTAYVDDRGFGLLFGCSSFEGVDAERYLDAFSMLHDRHLAPKRWLPKVKSPQAIRFAERLRGRFDQKRAMGGIPPLLRTYLAMGGWVSDHAVVDRDLGTLHVFTGVEIARIPAARKRLLRALVA
ncbi:MAG: GNAT family N-acyltransferase [Pseudomonadota bacterium]